MFPNFQVFDESNSVLLSQLEMASSKDVEPSPVKRLSAPMAKLYDECEALLATGRATTVSQAMEIIGRRDPSIIDRAADFKAAVTAPVANPAERAYFQAIADAKSKHSLSPESARELINKSRPDLREAFVAEHNARHHALGPAGASAKNASREYWNAVQTAQREKQLSQSQAMQYVNRHHADLRESMVREINS